MARERVLKPLGHYLRQIERPEGQSPGGAAVLGLFRRFEKRQKRKGDPDGVQ